MSRWYAPAPAKFLVAVLLMQSVLFLSSHYRWFWFNEYKGYTVLIAVAATTACLLLLALCVGVSWFFRTKAQFGLKTLLLIVPVTAIPCAWLAREVSRAREQRAISQWVQAERRGRVSYDDMENMFDPKPPWRRPEWMADWLGRDFFDDVLAVEFRVANDADVEKLKPLSQLRYVSLQKTQVSDVALEHLKGFNELKGIGFDGTSITDNGLVHLKRFTKLKYLSISHTDVTDAGLEHLKGLSQLESIGLKRTKVTRAGVSSLVKGMPRVVPETDFFLFFPGRGK